MVAERLTVCIGCLATFSMVRASAQAQIFPYTENFDAVPPPDLPQGWSSSQARSPAVNDFVSTAGSPRSLPNSVIATNATVGQFLVSPPFDFTSLEPGSLGFYTRRSSSFAAKIVVESSLDNGTTFAVPLGDTLRATGSTGYVLSSIPLPSILTTSSTVRFRWRIVPDGTGSSGTLRIDDVSMSVLTGYDLSLATLSIAPMAAVEGEEIVARATVTNIGSRTAVAFSLMIYRDNGNDSIPDPAELLLSVPHLTPLQSLDSVRIDVALGQLRPGRGTLIGVVNYPADQNPSNNRRAVPLRIGWRSGSLVVNEIMYAPGGLEPEWIELENTREDSICLMDWSIADATASSRHIVARAAIAVPPSGFIVLTKDSVGLLGVYPTLKNGIIGVPGFPSLNNSGDVIEVFDDAGRVIDSIAYRPGWGGSSGGKSLERVDPLLASADSLNWATCEDPLGGTPCRENSVAALDYDLRPVAGVAVHQENSSVVLRIVVRNCGKKTGGTFSLLVFDDADRDSVGEPDELVIRSDDVLSPARQDSVAVEARWEQPSPGIHRLVAVVDFPGDMRPANNSRLLTMHVAARTGLVMISEIMFAPLSGNTEYVEFVNTSISNVDLCEWTVETGQSSPREDNAVKLSRESRVLHGGEYFVVAADSSLFSQFPTFRLREPRLTVILSPKSLGLNNDGDVIAVRDAGGVLIDSVAYASSWHSPTIEDFKGRALEKIFLTGLSNDRRNWGTCVLATGGTPGEPNSIRANAVSAGSMLACTPNPFSPDGDGRDDRTMIHFEVPLQASAISIKVYDVKGRLIRRLANLEAAGPTGDIVWDGYDDEGRKARIGIYILFLEAMDDRQGILASAKGVVVLAGML